MGPVRLTHNLTNENDIKSEPHANNPSCLVRLKHILRVHQFYLVKFDRNQLNEPIKPLPIFK